jgi:hypothetical protein
MKEERIKLFADLGIEYTKHVISFVPSTAWTINVTLGMKLVYEETKVLQNTRLSAKVLQQVTCIFVEEYLLK